MNLRLLRAAIGFLSGVLWTLLLLSGVFTFSIFVRHSIFEAVVYTLFVVIFWLFFVVLVELAGLQLQKFHELRHQTRLLERIAKKLDER